MRSFASCRHNHARPLRAGCEVAAFPRSPAPCSPINLDNQDKPADLEIGALPGRSCTPAGCLSETGARPASHATLRTVGARGLRWLRLLTRKEDRASFFSCS